MRYDIQKRVFIFKIAIRTILSCLKIQNHLVCEWERLFKDALREHVYNFHAVAVERIYMKENERMSNGAVNLLVFRFVVKGL